MKLYKFRTLANPDDLERIKDIITNGFYCCNFLNFNDMNEGIFSINSENINIILSQKEQYKICSFSKEKALGSQLMWGHYANTGMGIVIEVEVDNCKNIKEVVYGDNYDDLNFVEDILTYKSKEWSYEEECRYISKSCCDRALKENITTIYFGTPYEQLENYKSIKKQHKKLKEYLELKKNLKDYAKKIPCKDYDFNKNI